MRSKYIEMELGINPDSIGIKIQVMGGNNDILDDFGIPYAFILDSDDDNPEELCRYLVKNTKIQQEGCYILKKISERSDPKGFPCSRS